MAMQKPIGQYLKEKRLQKGYSLRDVAKQAGVSHQHIRDVEEGKKTPTFNWLMKIVRALAIDVSEFLKETGYLPVNVEPASLGKLRQIPVVSWVIAGKWSEVCDAFQPGDADEWIETDVKGVHVFALMVKGDSMEPEFYEGDIIVVNPHVEPVVGDFVIVKNSESEEATFKQLKKYGDILVLHPLNPKYPDIEIKDPSKYRIIGKVVEKKKKY